MARQKIKHRNNTPARVGLYIQSDTRAKLNLVKAELSLECGKVFSQDDAIDFLIDAYRQQTVGKGDPVYA